MALSHVQNHQLDLSDRDILEALLRLEREHPDFAQAISIREVLPWECVAAGDELADHLYIIIEGLVQIILLSREERRLVASVLGPGAVFGEGSILHFSISGPPTCAQAIQPTKLWAIPADKAKDLVIQYPELRLAMFRTLGQRMIQVENRLEEVAYRWLPERLAIELLRQSQYAGSDQIRISHQALADILGTYRETISAILRDFREAGWVKLGYRRIMILDRDALERMSGVVRK